MVRRVCVVMAQMVGVVDATEMRRRSWPGSPSGMSCGPPRRPLRPRMWWCASRMRGCSGRYGRLRAGRSRRRTRGDHGPARRARSSRGGALVVRGVAGSGKSTLLGDAGGSAVGMTVLRTQGVESESPLAFAALQRLLWALRARLQALPAPQRTALRAALGETEGDGVRFLAFLGT